MATEVSVVGDAAAVYVNGELVWPTTPPPPPPPPPPPVEPQPPASVPARPYASPAFGSGRYA